MAIRPRTASEGVHFSESVLTAEQSLHAQLPRRLNDRPLVGWPVVVWGLPALLTAS